MSSWFEIDRKGMAEVQDPARLILELVQNAWDEKSTRVDVTIEPVPNRPQALVTVTDDNPDGFAELEDCYTLFRRSKKRGDPGKRGRFNYGEKRFLSCCESATISSTKGTEMFLAGGQRRSTNERRESGTRIHATLNITREDLARAMTLLKTLFPPTHIRTTVNVETLAVRVPAETTTAELETEVADSETGLPKRTRRKTDVILYEPLPGEQATIYELGIPVVECGDRYHVNVQQKVPLNQDRDNVTPAYLRRLREVVLNAMHKQLTPEDAKSVWVKQALPQAEPEAVKSVIVKAHGRKSVVFDPSCPEANKRALDEGYSVVHGGSYGAEEWAAIRRADALKPAGAFQHLRGDVQTSPDGVPPIPRADWQPHWVKVADYAVALARELCDRHGLGVQIYRINDSWRGACGKDGLLMLNVRRLPREWWSDQQEIDRLMLHEFAHFAVKDHLSDDFHRECCRLGAKLRTCKSRLEAL